MTPQRRSHIKEVFFSARQRARDEDRCAYIESVCGNDQELRAEVERLLANDKQSSLGHPAADYLESIAAQLVPGQMLAQYRVEAKLGEGGMGAVYRAYDTRLSSYSLFGEGCCLASLQPSRKPLGRAVESRSAGMIWAEASALSITESLLRSLTSQLELT